MVSLFKIQNKLTHSFALFLTLVSTPSSVGWAITYAATEEPEGLYDQLYPYYAEYCGTTQYKPLNGVIGGRGGHAVLYIKGICLDKNSTYPRVQVCSDGTYDPKDPNTGTFISVDAMYRSVNWIGIEGKRFFLKGILDDHERVTQKTFDETIDRIMALGYFRGIRTTASFIAKKPKTMSEEEYLIRESLGTGFAINYVRNSYCSRIPIKKESLPQVVKYLNERNDPYGSGQIDFEWKLLGNNCAHTTHNALAAAGVWSPRKTDEFIWIQLFNLAIPANEFIQLEHTGNDEDLRNIDLIYLDPVKKKDLMELNWLPIQPGVVVEKIPTRQENDLFNTDSSFGIFDLPLFWPEHHRFEKYLNQSRFNDLFTNLEYFEKKYRRAKANQKPIEDLLDRTPGFYGQDFEIFYKKYYDYLDQEISRVSSLKELLAELQATMPIKRR